MFGWLPPLPLRGRAVVDVGEADKQAGFTWTESYYNPYRTDTFQDRETGRPITSAKFVDLWIDEKDSQKSISLRNGL